MRLHWRFHGYAALAAIRKFMVGDEMLAPPQRDIALEAAATMLRGSAESFG